MPSSRPTGRVLLDAVGGPEVLRETAVVLYRRVFADPLLPLFERPDDDQFDRMVAWLVEAFGGDCRHTLERGGFTTLIQAHRGLGITDAQRLRWLEHMTTTARETGMPTAARPGSALWLASNT